MIWWLLAAAFMGAYLAIGSMIATVGWGIGLLKRPHRVGAAIWIVIAWPVVFVFAFFDDHKRQN